MAAGYTDRATLCTGSTAADFSLTCQPQLSDQSLILSNLPSNLAASSPWQQMSVEQTLQTVCCPPNASIPSLPTVEQMQQTAYCTTNASVTSLPTAEQFPWSIQTDFLSGNTQYFGVLQQLQPVHRFTATQHTQ